MEFLPYEHNDNSVMGVSQERVKELLVKLEAEISAKSPKGSYSRETMALSLAGLSNNLNEFFVVSAAHESKQKQQEELMSKLTGLMGGEDGPLGSLLKSMRS